MKRTAIIRLIRDDVRRLAGPGGLFLVVLLAAGLARWPGADVWLGPSPWRVFDLLDAGVWLTGLLLAGLFGQLHSIHRRAFWRTRPLSVRSVVVVKLIEVVGLVWLPMAMLQLVLLSTIETEGRFWPTWLGELFVIIAGPLLFAATIGALTRSVRSLLVASFALVLLVGTAPVFVRQLAGVERWIDAATFWSLLAASAVVMWVTTFLSLDRRRVAWLGVALALVWVGLHAVPSPSPPELVDPAISVEVESISTPQRRPGSSRQDRVWLCVDVELGDRADVGWHVLSLEGTFRGSDVTIGRASPGDRGMTQAQRAWESPALSLPGSASPSAMTLIFNGIPPSRFERDRYARGSVELEIMVETWTERIVASGPVQTGVIMPSDAVTTPLVIRDVAIDEREREVVVRLFQKYLLHLTGRGVERPDIRIVSSTRSGLGTSTESWWDPEISSVDLPFIAAQRVWREQPELKVRFPPRQQPALVDAADRDGAADRTMSDLASDLRWQVVEPILLDRRFARWTLDDVTLGEMACEPERRDGL